MKTLVTDSPLTASKFIRHGELASFPTETVYGLGANVFNEHAVKRIFRIKGRPADNPLIVHVASKRDINLLAESIPPSAKRIIKEFFPGPVTLVLIKREIIPDAVTSGLNTIAVRMPSLKLARELIKLSGVPIAAPSANLSGSPSPTSFVHALKDFSGKIPCILKGPETKFGIESTVVDCTSEPPVILRPGAVTLEDLKRICQDITYKEKFSFVRSPGQKYRHYAPECEVKIISKPSSKGFSHKAYIGLTSPADKTGWGAVKICRDKTDYAKSIFGFFRQCDETGIKIIETQRVSEKGIGLAIMNRLKKAAH